MALESISALILDDNAHMRGLVRVILTGFGVRTIEEAGDCAQAVSIVAGGDIDIAFVDMKLAGLDGLEFCRRMRLAPRQPKPLPADRHDYGLFGAEPGDRCDQCRR